MWRLNHLVRDYLWIDGRNCSNQIRLAMCCHQCGKSRTLVEELFRKWVQGQGIVATLNPLLVNELRAANNETWYVRKVMYHTSRLWVLLHHSGQESVLVVAETEHQCDYCRQQNECMERSQSASTWKVDKLSWLRLRWYQRTPLDLTSSWDICNQSLW